MDTSALPGLAALRCVEAAARLRSYTLAARELHVTHSAVSHQVRALEARLGAPLFTRAGPDMLPTPACERLAGRLRRTLAELAEALDEAAGAGVRAPAPLELSVMADFANLWLIPRLDDLARELPELELSLRLHTGTAPPDPRSADVGIWHRRIEERGYRSERLLADRVIAVAAPALLTRHPGLTTATLPRAPLLRFVARSWQEFFTVAGLDAEDPGHGVIYSDAEALLRAALADQGVAMVRRQLAEAHLRGGELVRIGEVEIPAQLDYYFSRREDHPRAAVIEALRGWLRARLDAAP
ncbi:LysR substrate-binding domain-containing protein [Kitasatospora sp. NPDC089797]|uniref:LysR substrate-binding domain-containing protein n=1 Tax=Kitasatospora sp. NPDC089797 TaxID=3155298 RepID=UPI00341CC5F7